MRAWAWGQHREQGRGQRAGGRGGARGRGQRAEGRAEGRGGVGARGQGAEGRGGAGGRGQGIEAEEWPYVSFSSARPGAGTLAGGRPRWVVTGACGCVSPDPEPTSFSSHLSELLVQPKWKPSSLDPAVLGAPSWHPGPCVPPALLHLKGCHEARVCRGVAGCLRIVSTAQGSEGSSAPDQQDLSQTGGRGGPPGRRLCDSLLMDLESKSLHSGRAWGWGHGAAAAETPSMPGVGVVQETLRAAARTPAAGVSGLGSLGWGLLWSMSTSHAPLTPAAPHPSQARSVSVWPWVPTLSPESRSSLSKAAAIHTDPENVLPVFTTPSTPSRPPDQPRLPPASALLHTLPASLSHRQTVPHNFLLD